MTEIAVRVSYGSREEAAEAAEEVQKEGAQTEISEEPGLLPLPVLLAITIPPGVALLAKVVDRIVHGWKDHGLLVDARGTGAPAVIKDAELPYGTVIILTRDGEKAERSELTEEKLSEYVAAALKAVAGGASAPVAADEAGKAAAEPETGTPGASTDPDK